MAYTACFPLARYDESPFAQQVTEWIGINHRLLPVEAHNLDTLEKLAQQFDEPFADSSLLPNYMVSQATRPYVKVALSGDGRVNYLRDTITTMLFSGKSAEAGFPQGLRTLVLPYTECCPWGPEGKTSCVTCPAAA